MLHSDRMTRVFNHKKGQGLSISTIILAALGILVLVVLGYVFSRETSEFGKEIGTAGEGTCSGDYEEKPVGTQCEVIYGNFKGLGTNNICCKKGTAK